jgi:PIN domain nuclease of toxin-antitoxin system
VRLLLDTHVLLWALRVPGRLSPTVRRSLDDRRNELVISAATPWEIATKFRKGKLPAGEPVIAAYSEQLWRFGATELAVTSRHTIAAGLLDWDHNDPFDRILAAQSIIEGIPLVTDDRAFRTLPGVQVIW